MCVSAVAYAVLAASAAASAYSSIVSSFLTDRLPLRVFFLVEPVVMRGFAASQALALAARRLFNRAGSVAMASRRRR